MKDIVLILAALAYAYIIQSYMRVAFAMWRAGEQDRAAILGAWSLMLVAIFIAVASLVYPRL